MIFIKAHTIALSCPDALDRRHFPLEDLLLAHRTGPFLEQPLLDTLDMEVVPTGQLNDLLLVFDVVVANGAHFFYVFGCNFVDLIELLLGQSLRNASHFLLQFQ